MDLNILDNNPLDIDRDFLDEDSLNRHLLGNDIFDDSLNRHLYFFDNQPV